MNHESAPEKEDLLNRMTEAVLLPPNDPVRLKLAEEIAGAGAWAEDAWLDLLRQDEELRLELRRVEAPAGLAERLMRVPAETPAGVSRRWWAGGAIAAAALILAAMGWSEFDRRRELQHRFDMLGAAAVTHHQIDHPPALRNLSAAEAVAAMNAQKKLGFEAHMPDLESRGFTFVGATLCRLGGRPVPCAVWEKNGERFTMYQFAPRDHGLPESFAMHRVELGRAGSGDHRDVTVFWTESGRAYGLVADAEALAVAGHF